MDYGGAVKLIAVAKQAGSAATSSMGANSRRRPKIPPACACARRPRGRGGAGSGLRIGCHGDGTRHRIVSVGSWISCRRLPSRSLLMLNEAGLLHRPGTVSSVSGGSIVAGLLGLRWRELIFDANGVATSFSKMIIDLMLIFIGRGLDIAAVLTSAFILEAATLAHLPAQ